MVLVELVGVAALAVGGYLCHAGWRELRTVYHVLRGDPHPVRELDGYTGPVEVEGTAAADEAGTVTAPFTGSECLAYTYEVAELRSSGKSSSWHTLDEGAAGVDFLVDDGTGRVRVDPDGADLRLGEHSVRVSPGTELPDRLAEYVAATDAVDEQDRTVNLLVTELHVGNEQRFTERRLDVGESVYVYGQARRGDAPDWGSDRVDAVLGAGPGAPVFVVSDTGERATAWRFARAGLWRAGLGAVVLLLALLGLASLLLS
ncbi:GIDE domain-containing protein [Haloarcula litorea]|uniref:GIDE domain-containing protein n=1 Tax=Haloarcula litorea TaxID=3032579 RepID=UPI0023E79ED0|nr:GIDE domain-containing protein [Halomicroarcula sp. GDY20]